MLKKLTAGRSVPGFSSGCNLASVFTFKPLQGSAGRLYLGEPDSGRQPGRQDLERPGPEPLLGLLPPGHAQVLVQGQALGVA